MVGGMSSTEESQMAEEEHRARGAIEMEVGGESVCRGCTLDGSVDIRGRPASKSSTGGWVAGTLLLVNQGLATLAFFGVGVNLVLFLTRVMQQDNADAANNVSKWTGTVYLFSLVGAFLSDAYWGRYKTCAIFQVIFVLGLGLLSLSTYLFLLRPSGCGDAHSHCGPHSGLEVGAFYISIYMIALGNGGYQPNIATFGADQFDEEDTREARSKVSFFSYFYLALNMGSLFSNSFLTYFQDRGMWALGFWVSTGSALAALALFFGGTHRYRHFKPCGNPISRVCQVIVAASKKWRLRMHPSDEELFELEVDKSTVANGGRKLLHTQGFSFLDQAALISPTDFALEERTFIHDPWRICTVTQVEEVKCVLRLLPIWLCTIPYSIIFTQMASLFVEQGATMNNALGSFHIPPASMSTFDIISVAAFIFIYRRILNPLACRLRKDSKGLTELERMGVGLVIAVVAMVLAGMVEIYRLRHVGRQCSDGRCQLSILWQIPEYALIGASEVFMYVGQLEFFNGEAPDGLKSFGSALCMMSMSMGNYLSSLMVSAVMEVTAKGGRPGWIPGDLNRGHMDRFYFLLAALTSVDLVVYMACARWYRSTKLESSNCGSSSSSSSSSV